MEIFSRILGIIWKSLLIGAIYTGTIIIFINLHSLLPLSIFQMGTLNIDKTSLFCYALLLVFFVGAIAGNVPTSRIHHFLVWGFILFFNLAGITLEEILFAPTVFPVHWLPALLLMQAVLSLITSIFVTFLFADNWFRPFGAYFHRSWASWTWRFFGGSFSYLLIYFIFGAINSLWITDPSQSSNQAAIEPQVILIAELLRGPLTVLSLLPLIITVRVSKRYLTVICGLILSLVGGVLLQMQSSIFPEYSPAINPLIYLIQNFLTGVIIGLLMGYTSEAETGGVSVFEVILVKFQEIFNRCQEFFRIIYIKIENFLSKFKKT